MIDIAGILQKMIELKASDLFITADKPICAKVNGSLETVTDKNLTEDEAKNIILSLMLDEDRPKFEKEKELNFAYSLKDVGRWRVSVFYQRSKVGAVLRRIETDIPSLEILSVPDKLYEFAMLKRGLVILVGATGAGKSSTLAAMVDYRNQNSKGHIVTIEDPIEFMYQHKNCIITQREVGIDTESFDVALKNTLRQAPDVILIGEIRNKETMNYAINFSETGHLCLATLHANNANQALDRIISFFPPEQHNQIWSDLSLNFKAIVAQQLIPIREGFGRLPVIEVLVNTPVISNHIKKGEVHVLKDYMKKDTEFGMRTFDQALFERYKEGTISYDAAIKHADSANELRLMIKLDKDNQNKGTSSLDGVGLQD